MIGPHPPVHPGEILREEFLLPLDLKPYSLAKAINVPRPRIEKLVRRQGPVTADTALRLGRYFGTGPEFWMNLQANYDLATAAAATPEIDEITPRGAA